MPDNYATRGLLLENPELARRVRAAALKAAGDIVVMPNPNVSQERIARDILINSDTWVKRFVELVASFGALDERDQISDAAIAAVINQAVSRLAPRLYPPA